MVAKSATPTSVRFRVMGRLNRRPNRIGSQSEIPMRSLTTRELSRGPWPRTLREGRTEAYVTSLSQPHTPVSMWNRVFAPGMPEAVAARTVPRVPAHISRRTDAGERPVIGQHALAPRLHDQQCRVLGPALGCCATRRCRISGRSRDSRRSTRSTSVFLVGLPPSRHVKG